MTKHRIGFCPFVLLLCGAGELTAGYICQPGTPGPPATTMPTVGNTTFSVSYTCSEQVMTTNLTQRVDQFTTELLVRQLGGPLLLDQTFMVPFGDPLVQSALLSARQLLAGQGATGFLGPTLLGNNTTLTGSRTASQVIQTVPSQNFVTVSNAVGGFVSQINQTRISAQIGDIGQCQGVDVLTGVPFGCDPTTGNQLTVAFGTQNLNANTHTLYSVGVTNTTTNTFLTSQSYELAGTRVPANIPEPGTFASMALAIAGLWGLRARNRG